MSVAGEPLFTVRLLNSLLIACGHAVFLPALLWTFRVKGPGLRQLCFGVALAHSIAGLFLVSPFTYVRFEYDFQASSIGTLWLGVLRIADLQITLGWLAIAMFLLASRALSVLRAQGALRGLIRLRRRRDTALLRELETLACRMNVRPPRLAVIDGLRSTPFVAGFVRPVVVFSAEARAALDDAEARAVLAHELAHVRHRDTTINLLLELSRVVLFFSPFFARLAARYRVEVENARDVDACRVGALGSQLASGLLKIRGLGDGPSGSPAFAAFSTFDAAGRGRIERRLRGFSALRRRTPAWMTCLQAALLLVCVAFPSRLGLGRNAVHMGHSSGGTKTELCGRIGLGPTPGLVALLEP